MSMHNLTYIIGPAPSEMPRPDLLTKLSLERDRVRRSIIWFRSRIPAPKAKRAASAKGRGGKPASRLTTKMKNAGVTLSQMEAALKLMTEEKANDRGESE